MTPFPIATTPAPARRHRGARRRACGTASVEAVIALPVFIIVLSGVWFVRDRQLAIQSAANQARSCAWQYSANDCTEIPKGCEGVLAPGTAPRAGNKVDDALNDAKKAVLAGGDSKGVIEKVATGLLGPAIDALFGRFVDGNTSRTLNRPGALGDGQTVVTGSYHLACNLQPTTPGKVVKDAWDSIVHF
jgi:hypothetical protein